MLRGNNHFKQLPACSACYVATFVSSIFQDALDAMLYHLFPVTSKTFWMLLCNMQLKELQNLFCVLCCHIRFKHLPRRSACYVATTVSSNFQDVLHATFQQPFQATSTLFRMLCCNICVKHLPRRLDTVL